MACPPKFKDKLSELDQAEIEWLEGQIDEHDTELKLLRSFILQGGSLAGAQMHLARAVCRRAEREVVAIPKEDQPETVVITYLNRLSDLLFVLARYINMKLREEEKTWQPKATKPIEPPKDNKK